MTESASLSPLLATLFPIGVVAAELRQAGDPALLHPAEQEESRGFVAKRLGEFAAGRICARRALGELGIHGFALRRGPDRRPRWPEDVVGSITHSGGYCGVALARRSLLRGIGLDAEQVARVTPEIWPHICTAREKMLLHSLLDPARQRMAALIFSAKEAFYKSRSAMSDRWIGFEEVEVVLARDLQEVGTFAIAPGPASDLPAGLGGRYRFEGDLVMTGLSIEAGRQLEEEAPVVREAELREERDPGA